MNERAGKVMLATGDLQTPVPLPGIGHGSPLTARFDGSADRVMVQGEDAREAAFMYTVQRGSTTGRWNPPRPLRLPPGCGPLDFGGQGEDGVVVRHHAGAGGTDLCWYDAGTGVCRVLHRDPGWVYGAALSPDRRSVVFLVGGPVSLSATVWVCDIDGSARPLHPPNGHAAVSLPAWTADGRGLVFSSAYGRDHAAVLHLDPVNGTHHVLYADQHDIGVRVLTGDDRLLILENRDGASSLALLDPLTSAHPIPLALPGHGLATVVRRPELGPGDELRVTFTAPGLPSAVWAIAPEREPRSLTPEAGIDRTWRPERFHVAAADSVRVPVLDWFPGEERGDGRPAPAVVALHGGPEQQWLLQDEQMFELFHQRGIAVFAADLRGSIGFGMHYSSLDDGVKNFDVLLDLEAVHSTLEQRGADPRRAVLVGASFGAYQVLLALAHQPQLWAAGVAVSGVSDPLSYLDQTRPHRRAQRELAYGSAERDGARMAEMSPLNAAAKITSPLLLVHGALDVRVPVTQSREMARVIGEAGGDVTLREFPDEGHRFASSANRAVRNQLVADFVTTHTRETTT
ncbi:S9 family peptidase [Actinorhabdospora filicis]|nr:prolyl oligopeptidase family serine peptidase [Actinorhabdospora filicis]